MKVLSLKLKDEVFEELEQVMSKVNLSRNAYINEAVSFYNKIHRKQVLKKKLRLESKLVSQESLRVAERLIGVDNHLLDA